MKAMILAAGFGTRLRPYTHLRPKPLFPVLNKPLLLLTIARLRQAEFSRIVVNAHHRRNQVVRALEQEQDVLVLEEETILGTGGGLRRALPHLGEKPVLVTNGDIYHNLDFRDLYRKHHAKDTDVSLVMHDYPRFNSVPVDSNNRIIGFEKGEPPNDRVRHLAFTGIHVINPAVLSKIEPDTYSCILDCYRNLLQQGGTINAITVSGHFWTDIGSPTEYLDLHARLLTGGLDHKPGAAKIAGPGAILLGKNTVCHPKAVIKDWACIGDNVYIDAGCRLSRVVIWDGTRVPAGTVMSDALLTPEKP